MANSHGTRKTNIIALSKKWTCSKSSLVPWAFVMLLSLFHWSPMLISDESMKLELQRAKAQIRALQEHNHELTRRLVQEKKDGENEQDSASVDGKSSSMGK